MIIDESTIRSLCTDAVFERGQRYHNEGRIQRIERFDDIVTAVVRGSSHYDVVVEWGADTIDARCTCPYDGAGECKHVVAVLLTVAADPPRDESEQVESLLQTVSADDLRAFLRDVLAEQPDLREQFVSRFGSAGKSVDDYRAEIEQLFDRHTQEYPVVTDAIDFSQFFEVATHYRERERYLEAATVYRALFEEIDANEHRIDAAYDHYASALQSALDGYVECVLAATLEQDEFETYIGVLEEQARAAHPPNSEQFHRAIDDLEDRR
ncbi:SWIM zinc finger domain protein [Natrialba magadii ATCC 43099]|uniref:SWIM zinc finger domain protein n=1 Tax=Natrialba magadii (strain ATCC 43099 / DSM 3394 / CCM 3739 / CIP 104546 / IAM 13178 / JCM 8861 / NBRC 102185 / NCIMB 2190 / MS3) TaxID=547559 RepID=D3SWG5_NATMM|nr:SWIM zinc finger family protein [Natrialba magadii]ADD03757.1 SWIM zinc finger domain protein [Natrialba magadii ATCC 43099]ELY33813.1 zinc finger SWIM domain-containing protein [Natrialba magadii ATCC 43099]